MEAENISISYGVCPVVAPLSFAVRAGETLVILGANGAGKTTLLRALNGALTLKTGAIRIEGKNLNALSRREIARKIAVVAQETETGFPISVLEFVLAGRFAATSSAFGWETARDLSVARNALLAADLANYEKRLMNNLSGGERQRAVFARALASESRLLLLDEPTANLDLAHQVSLLRLVRQKCARENFAAVVITHDLNLAAEFADKILLLKTGALVAFGDAGAVLTNENVRRAFGVEVLLDKHPTTGKTRVTTVY